MDYSTAPTAQGTAKGMHPFAHRGLGTVPRPQGPQTGVSLCVGARKHYCVVWCWCCLWHMRAHEARVGQSVTRALPR